MLAQLGNGLVLGTIIAITSVGLSLVFGVTRLINFAHGELVTLGAALALVLSVPIEREVPYASFGLPFGVTLVLVAVAGALLGAALDRGILAPLRRRGVGGITKLILTIGLALVVRHVILIWIGAQPQQYPLELQRAQTYLGFLEMTPRKAQVVLASFGILGAVGLFLTLHPTGKAMRALADNATLAEASGINVERVTLYVWLLAGALATTGGVFQGMVEQVTWDMGFNLLLLMFAGVILGGIGTAFGAAVGGIVVGLITQMSVGLPFLAGRADLKFAIALGIMVLILLVRPQGILGHRERVS